MTRSLMKKLKPVIPILIAVAMLASMIRTTISMSSSWSIEGARGERDSSLIVPERRGELVEGSDHAFDFDSLSAEQQRDKPFGYGPYWDVDPGWEADAWGSDDITVRDGALAITGVFSLSNSDDRRKGFIGVDLEPNLDINNKSDRLIRAEVKFEPALGSEQIVASIFVYDRQDAGPNCQDDECKWYRSVDTPVGGSADPELVEGQAPGGELVFDLNDPSQFNTCSTCLQFTDITTDSLKNMSRIGIQFYANQPYTGTIYLDNVTIGGTEVITNFVNLNEGFVTRSGSHFVLNGQPYRFAGNNTYYPFYKSHYMIDDMMETMQRNGIKVVRTWGFSDGKAPYANDGDGIADGNEGSAFQPELGRYYEPTFVNFDYVIKSAGEHGIRLIIPLVNYWSDSDTISGTNAFGGVAQYLEWCDVRLQYEEGRLINKDLFYTDRCAKEAYKAYVAHMINRTNTLTGVPYKDDPTILAWELINEPRCENAERCQGGQTLYDWAEEMSQYIKSLDPNHMVALGDEGFLSDPGNADRYYNGAFGVDWERNLSIESLDFGTVHLYPDHWDKDLPWASAWITDHITIAQEVGKPVVFEEFGICDDEGHNRRHNRHLPCNNFDRDQAYAEWIELFEAGAAGDALWMIAGKVTECNEGGVELNGECFYPNYDGFTSWEPSGTMSIIQEHATCMNDDLACQSDSPVSGESDIYLPLIMKPCDADGSKYGFCEGTMGWAPEEGAQDTQAVITVTHSLEEAYKGRASLQLTVDLIGGNHATNSKGEVFVDMRHHLPAGTTISAPYNVDGKPITCWVKAPSGSEGPKNSPNGFQLFVKDAKFKSEYGTWVSITPERVDTWFEISLTPSTQTPPGGYMDPGFDPTQLILLGVKIGTNDQSTAQERYQGPIYVDACHW